jgi:hypothetical protein
MSKKRKLKKRIKKLKANLYLCAGCLHCQGSTGGQWQWVSSDE